jgi:transposase
MTTPRRHELSDEQWAKLEPLLPPEKRAGPGRPALAHRRILNGILWILRTGAPWRDLPERYGNWATVYRRFRRWQHAGIWEPVFAPLKRDAHTRGAFDWAIHHVDGSSIRAHEHAAGARRTPAGASGGKKRGTTSRQRGARWDAVAGDGAASCTSVSRAAASPWSSN